MSAPDIQLKEAVQYYSVQTDVDINQALSQFIIKYTTEITKKG